VDELPGSLAPMSAKGEYRMALYEHTVMTRQDISAQQAEALNDTIKALIEEGGGSVAKIEYWGLRNLTYRVKKNRKAHYSLMAVDCPPAAMAEVERQLSINEDVLRWLTIRVEELDLELSPLLARRERERDRSAPRGEDAAASE
jgi:small subunit ribosomal protein S6